MHARGARLLLAVLLDPRVLGLAALHVVGPVEGGPLVGPVVEEQGPGAAERLGHRRQHEDARQGRPQRELALDRRQGHGADLLPHSDAAVQQCHLQRRAHLLPLRLGALVQRGDEAEGDGEGAGLGHHRGGHAGDGEGPLVPDNEGGQGAHDRPDEDAGGVHRSGAERRLQQEPDDDQRGDQLQHGLALAPEAERGDALRVGQLLGRPRGRVLAALVDGVREPLPAVKVPGRVPDPHQALHDGEVVEEEGAALHGLDDVHDGRADGLCRRVGVALERRLPSDEELYTYAQRVEGTDAEHELEHVLDRYLVDLHDREGDEVADRHHEDEDDLHGHLLVLGRQVRDECAVGGLQDVDGHVHHPVHGGGEVEGGRAREDVLGHREEHPRHPRRDQARQDDGPAAPEAGGAAVGGGADERPCEEPGDRTGHIVEGGQSRAHAEMQHVGGAVRPDETPEHLDAQLRQGHQDELPQRPDLGAALHAGSSVRRSRVGRHESSSTRC
mmetsp:Transcript_123727/g.350337  ORF Transcript_123727/g.350337 Transcript_123727/m.350337 type:complete len:499 (+) Transcript_123727:337-1833(+)